MSQDSEYHTEAHDTENCPKRDDNTYSGLRIEKMFLLAGDLFLISLVDILVAHVFSNYLNTGLHLGFVTFALTVLLYPPLLYAFDLYNLERLPHWPDLILRITYAAVITSLLSGLVLFFVSEREQAQIGMASTVSLWALLLAWRYSFNAVVRVAIPKIPAVVVAAGPTGNLIKDLSASPFFPYEIKASLGPWAEDMTRPHEPPGEDRDIRSLLRSSGARRAILAIPQSQRPGVARDMVEARFRGTVIEDMTNIYEQFTGRVPVGYIEDQWLFSTKGFGILHRAYLQRIKRLADILVSLFLLGVCSLPALICIVLIKIDSKGPILYEQDRVGKDGRVFRILKFRSMKADAEVSGVRWASREDNRTTRVGKWFRLYHVDEIPQLWNVLKGDMSIVGPRPERPEFVRLLETNIPYYSLRHSVRPGLSGWAQVTFRYGASLEDASRKLESDLYYIKNMSLFLDFKILLRTIGIVFLADGSR